MTDRPITLPPVSLKMHKPTEVLDYARAAILADRAASTPAGAAELEVKVTRATVYQSNADGCNRWTAQVQPGRDDNDQRISEEECEAVAQRIAAALSTHPAAPVSASTPSAPVESDGRLHADGYFTWNKGKRPDYIADRGLPCDFYLAAPPAAPAAPVGQAELSDLRYGLTASHLCQATGQKPSVILRRIGGDVTMHQSLNAEQVFKGLTNSSHPVGQAEPMTQPSKLNPQPDGGYPGCDTCSCPPGLCGQNATPQAARPLDVDALAQEIRRVDGNHTFGAGALAEALMPFLLQAARPAAQGAVETFRAYLRNEIQAPIDTSGDIARQEAYIDEADHLLVKFNEIFPEAS